jgi:OPT oligopeptide transporter protein
MNRLQGDHPPPKDAAYSTGREEQVPTYAAAEAERDISMFNAMHEWDPNINNEKLNAINDAVKAHDTEAEIALEHEIEENSPYPEVQAAVRAYDTDVPASTIRAWFLGMVFVTIGSGLNVLFSLRNPSISIGSLVAQLCSYPVGVFMAKTLPKRQFKFLGMKFSLNPGPFNKKEHTLITIMANVTFAQGAGM